MKTYHGYRLSEADESGNPVEASCVVTVCENGRQQPLRPRTDIRNHSPTGLEWGYCGSGPSQLALALVADCCGRKAAIPEVYQRVKERIVAALPHDGWTLTEEEVRAAVAAAQAEANGKRARWEGGGR